MFLFQLRKSSLVSPPRVVCDERDVEQRGVLLYDGELDLPGLEPLREDLDGVDPREEDAPELALFRRLEANVAALDLWGVAQ